jgi:DNA-binding NarL/FixJ family response regulator
MDFVLAAASDGDGGDVGNAGPASSLGVLLVDDDAIVRAWVRSALEGTRMRLVGEAGTAAVAIDLAARRNPRLLLVDYRLPDKPGTDLVRELRAAGFTAPALLITANVESGLNETARAAGLQGTIVKTGEPERLLAALDLLASGKTAFDGTHPPRRPGEAPLSPREREVMRLVAQGRTNHQVAEALGVGDETVKTLLGRTYMKLGVVNRTEAVSEAIRLGIL